MVYLIKDCYDIIYPKVSQSIDFELKLTERIRTILKNFTNLVDKRYDKDSIGPEWIWEYTIFQFAYYDKMKTARDVQINWIYGKKALDRWVNREKDYAYYNSQYQIKYNIAKPVEIERIEGEKEFNSRERSRFYGTDEGYFHCYVLSLFSEFNKQCIKCKFNEECKDDKSI